MFAFIIGSQNPVVGKAYIYEISSGSLSVFGNNTVYEWYLYKKQKNGNWKDITGTQPKKGQKVSYTFHEPVLGNEFELRVFEIKSGAIAGVAPTKKQIAKLDLVPTNSKTPQIDKVVLMNRGAKDINKAHYRDTLVAQAFCTAMFAQEVEFQLWEDDAPKGGHNPTINKNNKAPRTYKSRVNEKGIAEVKIPLSADERILRQIANKYVMKGSKDEGKNHEYYVTASYHGKIQRANKVNVDVANPDNHPASSLPQPKRNTPSVPTRRPTPPARRPATPQRPPAAPSQPKQNTPRFPATPTSPAPRKTDAQGRIINAYFVNGSGQKLSKVEVGDKVQVRILTSNMIGKHLQYIVWEYDTASNDKIYESGRLEVKGNDVITGGFTISESIFKKGIDVWGDPDKDSQNYFIEVIPLDVSAYTKRFGVDSDGLMKVESGKSPAVVNPPRKNTPTGKCFCNKDFEEKDVRKLVKLLKGTETIWEGVALRGGKRAVCNISDKSFSTLTKELNIAFRKYNINTCARKMHFLSQVCEETGTFTLSEELAGKYASSQSVYKGRGLIQLTGVKKEGSDLYNLPGPYQDYADYIGDQTVVTSPAVVANNVHYCIDSATWMWSVNKKAPSFKEGKKDTQIVKQKKQRLRTKYKEILGKTPNQIADYVDKYQLEIGKVINGFHENTDPYNQDVRKENYLLLKNNFFEYPKYHENINEVRTQKITDEIVNYHIFENGDIEKHIPKKIKSGYENIYGYIYHDSNGNEHDICTAKWHITRAKNNGTKPGHKPTHSKILSDRIVNEGQTDRRVIYESGDIAEYGSNDGKTFWVLYTVTSKNIELVRMPDSLDYNHSGVKIKYQFTNTQRRYTDPDHLAVFIGALAECGFDDVQTTGSCFREASCFPSVEHVNGKSIDTLYLDDTREQKLINAFHKYGITKQLRGHNKKAFKYTTDGKKLHNSHLHSGIIAQGKIKIIKQL